MKIHKNLYSDGVLISGSFRPYLPNERGFDPRYKNNRFTFKRKPYKVLHQQRCQAAATL